MNNLALIGKNILHSQSQKMYEEILQTKISYTLIDCPSEKEIPAVLELFEKFEGISITSPYKKHFLGKVKLNDDIRRLGCINCLGLFEDGVHGTNTDYLAIYDYITHLRDSNENSVEVIILGDGSMSNITTIALDKIGISYQVLSRRNGDDLDRLNLMNNFSDKKAYKLLINTCSREFIFNGVIDSSIHFWDYNYSFKQHLYLNEICDYKDGLSLLKSQAKFAIDYWKN